MRSLVTGLVMLVDLLKSHDTRVLAAACAVIGILAKEPANLAILTDYDIVQRLSSLVHTVINYEAIKVDKIDWYRFIKKLFICRAIRTSRPIYPVLSDLAACWSATVTRSADSMQYYPFPNTYILIPRQLKKMLHLLYTVYLEMRLIVWLWNPAMWYLYGDNKLIIQFGLYLIIFL